MVLFPEVMRKAQDQIDEVVGRSRLPNSSDRNKLPYIRAMVKEVSSISATKEYDKLRGLCHDQTLRWKAIGE